MKEQPAFPSTMGAHIQEGMTLRDYFAAQAMNALIIHGTSGNDLIALRAYEQADAMMKERAE